MNLYVTTEEIKTYIGISSSTYDTLIEMLNKQATAMINGILSVSDFSLHKVTGENPEVINGHILILNDRPLKKIGTIDQDGDEYTQDDDYTINDYMVILDSYLTEIPRKITVEYSAGYNARGMAYIDVEDYSGLATETITVNGTTITEGTEFDAETDNDATATNISSAIDDITGVDSFSIGNRVYIIDGIVQGVSKDISVSDSTDLTLSSSKLDALDFPEDIRMAVFLLISDMYSRRSNPRMQSYTIGSKTVQFSNESSFQMFRDALKPHMSGKVHSI